MYAQAARMREKLQELEHKITEEESKLRKSVSYEKTPKGAVILRKGNKALFVPATRNSYSERSVYWLVKGARGEKRGEKAFEHSRHSVNDLRLWLAQQ